MSEASLIHIRDHFFLMVGILQPKSQKNGEIIILNIYKENIRIHTDLLLDVFVAKLRVWTQAV